VARRLTVPFLALSCALAIWSALPGLVVLPGGHLTGFLTSNVSGGPCLTCPREAGISHFTITVRNYAPWPMFIRDAKFDLMGVEWIGPRCAQQFSMIPFGGYTCRVTVMSFDWGKPAERIDVEFTADVTDDVRTITR
jgi:hypothetical protein